MFTAGPLRPFKDLFPSYCFGFISDCWGSKHWVCTLGHAKLPTIPQHFITSHSSAPLHVLLLRESASLSCCCNKHHQVSVVFNNTRLFLASITLCLLLYSKSLYPEKPLSENYFFFTWQRKSSNVGTGAGKCQPLTGRWTNNWKQWYHLPFPYVWNATICPPLSPFLKTFKAVYIISSFVKFFCWHQAELAHFSSFSKDSGPTSKKSICLLLPLPHGQGLQFLDCASPIPSILVPRTCQRNERGGRSVASSLTSQGWETFAAQTQW